MPALKWAKQAQIYLYSATLLAIAASLAIVQSQTSNDSAIAATYSHSTLRVSIPYRADRAGSGQLTVEILTPEDSVVASSQSHLVLAQGMGHWQVDLKPDKPIALEDLVWHRLRYRFTYGDPRQPSIADVESISQILRLPVMRVLGQQSYTAGGPAAVRVVIADSAGQMVPGAGTVRIELADAGQPHKLLFAGPLNRRGTVEAQFSFPAGTAGAHALHYLADTTLGTTEMTQNIRVENKSQILLTTEKTLYQPGQTIHARALALDRATHEATANHKLTFELQDSRGNKIFRNATQTDEFGVASADFALADEVNLGAYHLHVLMEGPSQSTSELTLDVERYVLPKFKVALELSGKDQQAAHGYRPGDHVTGTVRANYFFGKSVGGGEVTVKASSMDFAINQIAATSGKTDGEGAWRFDFTLPDYFAGRQGNQAARVLVEATVKDTAGHSETRGEAITVSESPILITAVPEGGSLVRGLENQVFILTSYAGGQPASTQITVNKNDNLATDAGGVAIFRTKPGNAGESLEVEARDQSGNHATASIHLNLRGGDDQILLRTEHAVYRAGDQIRLNVFSTRPRGAAYVDIVKDGQTVLTRDLDIVNGHAALTVNATPDLAGAIDCNAYMFGSNAQQISDHRLAFVQPADELKIEATSDAAVYKPGDDARIHFRVTNAHGEGVRAALGLQIVDEAVFALAEKQPGFAKIFFYLEQEVMKPRYEIHSIGMPEVLTTADASRDLAGRALFAATEMAATNRFDNQIGRTPPQTQYAAYRSRYVARFQAQAGKLADLLNRTYDRNPKGDVTDAFAELRTSGEPLTRDAWGNDLLLDRPWPAAPMYRLSSAGPDKRFDSGDDLTMYLNPGLQIDLSMEHDRGPLNGRAEVTGAVLSQNGSERDATVTMRSVSTGKTIATHADADGQFHFSAVMPGEYRVEVTASGFKTATRTLTLQARDRAILSANLAAKGVDSVSAAPVFGFGFGQGSGGGIGNGKGGGVAGGAVGGVLGGIVGGIPSGGGGSIRPYFAAANVDGISAGTGDTWKRVSLDENSLTLGTAPATHVRRWFPEALYINPEIITDRTGAATIAIPMADSITTWKMAMVASTARGALGSGTSSLKVFQDFFADLDLPVTLTQGDRVSIPVGLYNYSGSNGDVELRLQPEDWYALVSDTPEKTVTVESGRVGASQFTLEARRIGKFKLTFSARMTGGVTRADVLVREIEVVPNGREQSVVYNGRLESTAEHAVDFPGPAIADASKVFVRLYPGPLSQVIEGMDSILRMPGGCFEQTSSSTYPNVLALAYMKRTGKLTPEVHAKAEGYIANGYQRLLTFEVPGGGFSWFGQAPANKILTAYGLMEFSDMAKVYDVDPNVIQRTQQWLAGQQQSDGSWKPDTNFINEGATNRYNSDILRITAYLAWSLENTGYRGPAVDKARQYIEQNMSGAQDAYTLAVVANFSAESSGDRALAGRAIALLMSAAHTTGDQTSWTTEETGFYGGGTSAAVETTGLAVQALLKSGMESSATNRALAYIAAKKDANGTWGATQATIMALRSVLLSTEKGAADVRGTLELSLNGKAIEKLELTPENNDLLHQFVFKAADLRDRNAIAMHFTGKGALAYQVVGSYFLPWDAKPANEPLSIDVAYDRSQLAQNDIATATATVRNNLPKTANMVMVDLGIPPGFDLLSEDLQDYVEKSAGRKSGRLQKFSLTATQAILYFDSFAPGDTVHLNFRLRAKYPIRARTFPSRVYEYYEPEVNAVARPVQLEVRQK